MAQGGCLGSDLRGGLRRLRWRSANDRPPPRSGFISTRPTSRGPRRRPRKARRSSRPDRALARRTDDEKIHALVDANGKPIPRSSSPKAKPMTGRALRPGQAPRCPARPCWPIAPSTAMHPREPGAARRLGQHQKADAGARSTSRPSSAFLIATATSSSGSSINQAITEPSPRASKNTTPTISPSSNSPRPKSGCGL